MPKKSQNIQICTIGQSDEPAFDRIINDLVVLDSFVIKSNGEGQSTFQTGVINPVKYNNRVLVETNVELKTLNNMADFSDW